MEEQNEYRTLIARTLIGEREAYGELYEKTIDRVYKAVHFLIEDKSDVEDVIQDIYIQLYRSLVGFDQTRSFLPWLMGIVMRQVSAYRRKRWMRFRIAKKAELQPQPMESDFTNDVINKLANKHLRTAIDLLPYKLKQVIILRYLHDHSQEEIAIILDIPIGTVKSRINAALKKLRQKQENEQILLRRVENIHESR
ncbi:sigma-70 family RNA polymerase sigma factor [Aneurinibacillus sp. REN35]|uniref:sigma-70 family RNA polymerase sigma factor n=1 Tax=Aneurinibacillus sp. REN35 TaxID=3237286 RepID=UPI003529AB89